MSTPTQILVSKYHSPLKETGLPGETADSKARKYKVSLKNLSVFLKQSKEVLKKLTGTLLEVNLSGLPLAHFGRQNEKHEWIRTHSMKVKFRKSVPIV